MRIDLLLELSEFDRVDKKVQNTVKFKEKVVIIIPTHNESCAIEKTIIKTFETLKEVSDYTICILIFDSASTDNTVSIIRSLQNTFDNLYLKTEEEKTGLGSAYLQAMNYALTTLEADIIFEFDADLSHQPKYILPMLKKIKDYDCVIGSRYVKGGSIPKNWQFHRKLFSIVGNYVARAVLHHKYKDFTSGFRAIRGSVLKKTLPQHFLSNNYAYKLHLVWLLHKVNARIYEYPIDFIDREAGESKLPKHSVRDSLRVIFTLRYYELKRYFKMCLVGGLGIAVQLLIYNILRQFLLPFTASQFAVLGAVINNFILNNRFTFNNGLNKNHPTGLKKCLIFTVYSLFAVYLQSVCLRIGMHYFGTGVFLENSLLLTGILFISVINYFIYSRFIWTD